MFFFFYSLVFGFVVVFPGCIGFGWSLARVAGCFDGWIDGWMNGWISDWSVGLAASGFGRILNYWAILLRG